MGLWCLTVPCTQWPFYLPIPLNWILFGLTQLILYLLNWESELLAKSLDWGKLGNGTVCCDAEGRREAVVDTTLGREPAEGIGEGSVLGDGTDEAAVTNEKEASKAHSSILHVPV